MEQLTEVELVSLEPVDGQLLDRHVPAVEGGGALEEGRAVVVPHVEVVAERVGVQVDLAGAGEVHRADPHLDVLGVGNQWGGVASV